MNTITPLPSQYAYTMFRSRLEARWAAYFDLLKLPWQYEPEGYELPQGNYCPDFVCSQNHSFFVEVKPNEAELERAKDKLLHLALLTHRCVVAVVGPPSVRAQWAAYPNGTTTDDVARPLVFRCLEPMCAWGVPYVVPDKYRVGDVIYEHAEEAEWQIAANLRFENGVAERLP